MGEPGPPRWILQRGSVEDLAASQLRRGNRDGCLERRGEKPEEVLRASGCGHRQELRRIPKDDPAGLSGPDNPLREHSSSGSAHFFVRMGALRIQAFVVLFEGFVDEPGRSVAAIYVSARAIYL